MYRRIIALLALMFATVVAPALDANRLAYLDDPNPFYPSRDFPKLITPQWIGEPGVEAAIILSIDDMRDPKKYEAYLRPIIDKLKELYGTASMSIMACSISPDDPQLQAWLREGLSIETHTVAHPCPLLGRGQFEEARATFESCISLMANIPGNKPVAFRMPCCDSINSTSPRFFYEIFNKPSPGVPHLSIDSSVFNITTANDPALPREWVIREDGRERFRSYLPFKSFKTTIEDYPYPYIIGDGIWEFPCAVPSDWEAQNINKPNSPQSLADMKIALDAAVAKKGVYTLVFHPHGWIENHQIVNLIEHAATQYGTRVRFLSFRAAHQRLNEHLLGCPQSSRFSQPLVVRLLDLNEDGYMDVLRGPCSSSEPSQSAGLLDVNRGVEPDDDPAHPGQSSAADFEVCRVWDSDEMIWNQTEFPSGVIPNAGRTVGGRHRTPIMPPDSLDGGPYGNDNGTRFGLDVDGTPIALKVTDRHDGAWRFVDGTWQPAPILLKGLTIRSDFLMTAIGGRDRGVRFRDIDGDGITELLVSNDEHNEVFTRAAAHSRWRRAPFAFPANLTLIDSDGRDRGLRLIDVDGDRDLDILISNQDQFALYLFDSMKSGWSTTSIDGARDGSDPATAIPAIAVNGENNGAWFHSRSLWVQNETTDKLPDLVDRRSFNDLLATVEPQPKSPEAGLASISVRPGLRAELVAAEPLVVDPVSIAWGADGKLWVVEMRDYPLGMDGEGKPGSRVKFLEDVDDDGKYDEATVFLDKLNFATGVMPWRDGILITAAPKIIFAKDTNGDGRADHQEVLYDGFIQGNQQHRINGLRWGLDNWIHCANGDSGGAITSTKTGEALNISGRDFCFRVSDGVMNAESGMSQFGIAFDDWGNRFGCANWLPVWHYALDDRAMRRNPHFAPGNPREYIVPQAQLFPTSRTLARFNDFEHVNRSTSTCGIEIYRDTILGNEFYGNAFVCEPVHNLVLRTVLEPNGATFTGHRAPGEEESEFLSSHDNWFRPVMARMGPDGALYIVDMYRQVIEHPEYISAETQATLDLRAGDDKGRIYRVVPVHGTTRAPTKTDTFASEELVALLESGNGTVRDLAHQQLVERGDSSAADALRTLLRSSASAQARTHALCVLDGIDALIRDDLLAGLRDSSPGVRQSAVRLAAARASDWPEIGVALVEMQNEADALVRVELIYAIGELRTDRAAATLGELIETNRNDAYLGMALLSSLNGSNVRHIIPRLLAWAAAEDAAPEPQDQVIASVVGTAVTANDSETLQGMALLVANPEVKQHTAAQFAWLADFLDSLSGTGTTLDALGTGAVADGARTQIAKLTDAARAVAADASMDEAVRAGAASVLGRDASRAEEDIALLTRLLGAESAEGIRSASLDALIDTENERVPAAVLAALSGLSPELRSHTIEALLRREAWLDAVMTALENGAPSFRELDATHRQDLLTSKSDDIRARAEKLMAGAANPDRQAVIEQYKEATTIPGQFLRGRGIFRERCASCHQLGSVGHAVGPDLLALTDRSREAVLVSILDPNRAVETKYFDYTIETNDLMSYSGVVVEESGNSVTIRGANGIENTILRSNIESMTTKSRSPMPDGLEDGLTPEDMANLMAYILEARKET
ncbi:MAG: VCBS repeat-containing protein [Candidatus Hydrogenedentes bacterium]|nr:VCBS repeat-containing protein [Candidatus Hydrogenedentota bacterium]